MGLLTFSINVTLDGCVDHQEGIAGHGPTLYQSGLSSTRRLALVSAKPLLSGAVAMHYLRAR
jgi:hypothetical protein